MSSSPLTSETGQKLASARGDQERKARRVAMRRWHTEAAGTAHKVPFPRRSQQATRNPGWSQTMSIYVTDNPTWCPSDCKQSKVLRQEMSHSRRTTHRPEDILPGYAQPFLKAAFACAVAETDSEAGR